MSKWFKNHILRIRHSFKYQHVYDYYQNQETITNYYTLMDILKQDGKHKQYSILEQYRLYNMRIKHELIQLKEKENVKLY